MDTHTQLSNKPLPTTSHPRDPPINLISHESPREMNGLVIQQSIHVLFFLFRSGSGFYRGHQSIHSNEFNLASQLLLLLLLLIYLEPSAHAKTKVQDSVSPSNLTSLLESLILDCLT